MQNNIKGSLIGSGISNLYANNQGSSMLSQPLNDNSSPSANGGSEVKKVVKRKRNIGPLASNNSGV